MINQNPQTFFKNSAEVLVTFTHSQDVENFLAAVYRDNRSGDNHISKINFILNLEKVAKSINPHYQTFFTTGE